MGPEPEPEHCAPKKAFETCHSRFGHMVNDKDDKSFLSFRVPVPVQVQEPPVQKRAEGIPIGTGT